MNIIKRCETGSLASGKDRLNWTGTLREVKVLQDSSNNTLFKKRKESRLHLNMKGRKRRHESKCDLRYNFRIVALSVNKELGYVQDHGL